MRLKAERQQVRQQTLYLRKWFLLTSLFLSFWIQGCAKKTHSYHVADIVGALNSQAQKVRTMAGRAWVSIRSPEGSASFSGIVVIDLTRDGLGRFRVEALDPFGTMHHLMVLGEDQVLRWVDYDSQTYRIIKKAWQGVPLKLMSYLFVGVMPIEKLKLFGLGKFRVQGEDVNASVESLLIDFEQGADYLLGMDIADTSKKLALSKITAQVDSGGKQQQMSVGYTGFGDKKNFYMPQNILLSVGADTELSLNWKDRDWNEVQDPNIFKVSESDLKGFARENY